jgi:hypothetical protein
MYFRPVRQLHSVRCRIDKNSVFTRSGSYKYTSISSSTSTRRPIRHGPCVPSFLAIFAHSAVVRLYQDSRLFSLAQSTQVHPCGCCCNCCRHATTPNVCTIIIADSSTRPRTVDSKSSRNTARSAASRSNELYAPCSTRCRRNNRCVYLWTRNLSFGELWHDEVSQGTELGKQ